MSKAFTILLVTFICTFLSANDNSKDPGVNVIVTSDPITNIHSQPENVLLVVNDSHQIKNTVYTLGFVCFLLIVWFWLYTRRLVSRYTTIINYHECADTKETAEKIQDPLCVSSNEDFQNRLIDVIEKNIDNTEFGVVQLGKEVGLSRSQLHRRLRSSIDQTPSHFIRSFRLQRAYDLMHQYDSPISEIAYRVGFSCPSYFAKCFRKHFGFTPNSLYK